MLLLVVLPLLCLMVITVALCVAHVAEAQERKRKRARARLVAVPPPLLPAARVSRVYRARPFAAISILDAFEPETALLWETQVPALHLIARAGPDGLEPEALNPFYLSSAASYPELYDGTSFETWLEFLEDTELIGATGPRIVITPIGAEFLKCRVPVHARV